MCSSAEIRLTSSAIMLETGEFPAGKRKMILPGWLKKRPQQGAGKGINKHGSSRHSRALLGLAPRLEEAPEGLEGRSPTWGGWGEGRGLASRLQAQGLSRRHQPALPLRGVRAPRGLCTAPAGAQVEILKLHGCTCVPLLQAVCAWGGPMPGFLRHPPHWGLSAQHWEWGGSHLRDSFLGVSFRTAPR